MKIKTIFSAFLLLIAFSLTDCASSKVGKNPASVEEAEAALAKKRKKEGKAAKKAKKESEKRYWDLQSKETKKSVKKNLKRQKKIAKQKKK